MEVFRSVKESDAAAETRAHSRKAGAGADEMGEIDEICRGYRSVIAQQSRVIMKMALDFQQQILQLARSFQRGLAELEMRRRTLNGQAPAAIQAAAVRRRRAAIRKTSESTSEDERDSHRRMQLLRIDSKRKGLSRSLTRGELSNSHPLITISEGAESLSVKTHKF
jgi:hypothetical protein